MLKHAYKMTIILMQVSLQMMNSFISYQSGLQHILSKDPPFLVYFYFPPLHWNILRWWCRGRAKRENDFVHMQIQMMNSFTS